MIFGNFVKEKLQNLSFVECSLLHAEKQRESPAKLRCQIKDKEELKKLWTQ